MSRILCPAVFFVISLFSTNCFAGKTGHWYWENGKPVYVDFRKDAIDKITKRDKGLEIWQKATDIEYRDSRLPGGKLPVPANGGFKIPRDSLVKLAKKAVKAGRVTTPLGLGAMAAQEAWELCQEGKWFCKPDSDHFPDVEQGVSPGDPYRFGICSVPGAGPGRKLAYIFPGGPPYNVDYHVLDTRDKSSYWTSKGYEVVNNCTSLGDVQSFRKLYRGPDKPVISPSSPVPVTDGELSRGLDDLFDSQATNAQYDATYGEIEPFLTPDDVTDAHQSGQASSAPRDTTTTLPNGDVVKDSVHYEITYKDGDFTFTEITNTTINGENQGTTEKPLDPEVGLDYSDADLPEVPDFYEQKYPDGLSGVWRDRKADFDQTPMLKWLSGFADGIPQGGKCPEWRLPLGAVGHWLPGLGDADVSPPCWVWDFAKLLLLIGTVVACRRIVFGG